MNDHADISFPRKLLISCTVVAALACAPSFAFAQAFSPVIKINEAAANAEITVEPLRGGLSVLSGSGGNITVLSGKEGKVMVDAGIAMSRSRIGAALDKLGPGKVKLFDQYALMLACGALPHVAPAP